MHERSRRSSYQQPAFSNQVSNHHPHSDDLNPESIDSDADESLSGSAPSAAQATNQRVIPGGPREFPCDFPGCKAVYDKRMHLANHKRRHIGDKPYQCTWPECRWRFCRSDELNRHLRSHRGEKPFACKSCHKRYTRFVRDSSFGFLDHWSMFAQRPRMADCHCLE